MVTMSLSAMDNTIVSTAVPQVVRDLGGFSLFSWVFSSYLLTQTVTIPVYGKLADLWGRKPILIAGMIIFLAGSALCAGAWSMTSLILFRGLQGLGAGPIMATVNTFSSSSAVLHVTGSMAPAWLASPSTAPGRPRRRRCTHPISDTGHFRPSRANSRSALAHCTDPCLRLTDVRGECIRSAGPGFRRSLRLRSGGRGRRGGAAEPGGSVPAM
jgi:Major Facilitator Superfamily